MKTKLARLHQPLSFCKRAVVALICIIFTTRVWADGDSLRLPVGAEIYTLHTFNGATQRNHYFGVYRFPIEDTGGTELHLFPNGRFVISEWSDIGLDRLQATGSFRINADRLTLHFSRILPRHENLKTKFSNLHLLWGWIEKKDYMAGFEVFVLPADAWQMLKTKPEKARFLFLQRQVEYNDWQAILRDYDTQKE